MLGEMPDPGNPRGRIPPRVGVPGGDWYSPGAMTRSADGERDRVGGADPAGTPPVSPPPADRVHHVDPAIDPRAGRGAGPPVDRGRFSSGRKTDAVLAVLAGRSAPDVARELRVNLATLERWRERFVRAGREALLGSSREPRTRRDRQMEGLRRELESERRRAMDLAVENELLRHRCRALEERRALEPADVQRVAGRCPAGSARPIGVERACRELGLPRSTLYYHRARAFGAPRKPGPKTLWSDEELVAHVRRILETSVTGAIGHRKVWERLRVRGIRTSKARVLRLMREHGLLAFERPGRARRRR